METKQLEDGSVYVTANFLHSIYFAAGTNKEVVSIELNKFPLNTESDYMSNNIVQDPDSLIYNSDVMAIEYRSNRAVFILTNSPVVTDEMQHTVISIMCLNDF